MKASLSWASRLTNYIASSSRLLALLEKAKVRRPKRACSVRWYSTINMIESLIAAKDEIIQASRNHRESTKLEWMRDGHHWQILLRAIVVLRPLVDCIAIAERKNGSLGEAVHSLLLYARTLYHKSWAEPLIVEGLNSFLRYFGPQKLGLREFSLMLAAYVMNRSYKCDFITEDGLDLVSGVLIDIGTRSGCDVSALAEQFAQYSLRMGMYARSQSASESAVDWWSQIYGRADMKLVGGRIARLRSSSANIERTFSNLKWFQGSRRGRLLISTLMHISRIRLYQAYDQDEDSEDEAQLSVVDDQQEPNLDSSFDTQEEALEMREHDAVSVETLIFDHQPIDHDQHNLSLLADDTRLMYTDLKRYIDFNIINSESEMTNGHFYEPEPPTNELLEEMKKKYREKRLALRSNQPSPRESDSSVDRRELN